MTDRTFVRYEAYKDSGVEWLGEVPEHWGISRIKDFAEVNPTSSIPHTLLADDLVEFVPMTNVDGELGRIREYNIVPLRDVASGYTRFKNGDVIFAKITPCMENGNCAVVNGLQRGIGFGSTEFLVFRPGQQLTSVYLQYFLHNKAFRKNAEPFMKGSAGQKRVTTLYMATHGFALPPLPEQRTIAAYLDARTATLDRQIALLTQKAARYADLKQTLINHTVTHGLDPAAPLKDSGIEWIGEIPAHWEVKRVKDELISLDYKRVPLSGEVRDRMTNRQFDYYGASGVIDKVDAYLFDEPLILIGEDGANLLMRSSPLAFIARGKYWVNNHAHVLKPRKGNLEFFCYLLESFDYTTLISGAAQPKLTASALKDVVLMVPPLPEQCAIAAYLDARTAHIDRIIAAINAKIAALQELRQTLINDVVTGKIKVCDA